MLALTIWKFPGLVLCRNGEGVLIELMTSRVGSGKLLQLRGHRYWSQQALWGHSIFLSNWYFCLWREAYSARSIIHCKWFDVPVIYIGNAAHLEHCGRYRPELRGGADGAPLYCVPMVGEVKVADSAPRGISSLIRILETRSVFRLGKPLRPSTFVLLLPLARSTA